MTDGKPALSPFDLFTAFLKIGALGFGGVASMARHVLVVERRFLDDKDFAELFGLASTIPGANTVNLATILGDRRAGIAGAAAAIGGLLGVPCIALVVFATVYERFVDYADVRAALAGAAAAAAGLVGGTSLRLLRGFGPTLANTLIVSAVCVAAAIARWPMPTILATAIPASFLLRRFRTGAAKP